MNKDIIMDATTTTTTTTTSSELQLCLASPDTQEIFRPTLDISDVSAGNIQPITTIRPQHHHQNNPRKKRTKMIRFHNSNSSSSKAAVRGVGVDSGGSHSGGVIAKKKPDPSAPKITRPCTECGKRFWSWKALFGHMRCHPERPWRGINPPPNLHHQPPPLDHEDFTHITTEEDEYVAGCLLMLAKGPTLPATTTTTTTTTTTSYHHHHQPCLQDTLTDPESRFECSSCKKVFGSHQALGGHRASHKNVKGCFAITRNDGGTEELEEGEFVSHCDRTGGGGSGGGGDNMMVVLGSSHQQHRCTICLKIFSSGQALGGHKRCHWEKEDGLIPQSQLKFRFDLNLPPTLQEDDDPTCSASNLDLRLSL